jgi:hypothetical protein
MLDICTNTEQDVIPAIALTAPFLCPKWPAAEATNPSVCCTTAAKHFFD